MIEIKNIVKSFSGQQILKDLTYTYEKGITNLVIGQSGSGKTVLLKCLLGLYKPNKHFNKTVLPEPLCPITKFVLPFS